MSGSFHSSGLQDVMRTHGRPLVGRAANATTLSSTTTSGRISSKISRSRSSTYMAPSISACQVGLRKVSSWTIVGLRNSGAVSRMKSFQNWPGSSSCSGGGPRRMWVSSKPLASSVPAKDSSTMKITRLPRCLRTLPIPTQLLVGPNAPSGKNTMVLGSVNCASLGSLPDCYPPPRRPSTRQSQALMCRVRGQRSTHEPLTRKTALSSWGTTQSLQEPRRHPRSRRERGHDRRHVHDGDLR